MNSLKDELRDQSLHFCWSLIALLPLAVWQNPLAGACSGLLLALPRELWDQLWGQGQHLKPNFPWVSKGKAVDIGFFILGGFAAGIVALFV